MKLKSFENGFDQQMKIRISMTRVMEDQIFHDSRSRALICDKAPPAQVSSQHKLLSYVKSALLKLLPSSSTTHELRDVQKGLSTIELQNLGQIAQSNSNPNFN
jgi:hypothetical protein